MRFLAASLVLLVGACGDTAPPPAPLGTFLLDVETMAKVLTEHGVPEKTARRQAAGGRVRITFDPAGTFVLVVRGPDQAAERWSGTFRRSGDRITLRTTARGQRAVEPPDVVEATLDDQGRLHVRPPGGATYPFVLRRE